LLTADADSRWAHTNTLRRGGVPRLKVLMISGRSAALMAV